MKDLDFIYNRHSVRNFTDQVVSNEDINKIIKAATHAANGRNAQNWYFVVIRNKNKIKDIARSIMLKNDSICAQIVNEEMRDKFSNIKNFGTFFIKAPVLICVFASEYIPTGYDVLKSIGIPDDEFNEFMNTSPGIQNIGAAMENLMLAAATLGYGTCWMTSPNFAGRAIKETINLDALKNYNFVALTPLGVPMGESTSPKRKPLNEIMTILD
jgi:nitroreductase